MTTSTKEYGLIIFDLDGTLAPMDSDELYPDAKQWLENTPHNPGSVMPWRSWAIATNQGGIGLRHWMEKDGFGEPKKYPTLQDFEARIAKLFPDVENEYRWWLQMCARYQSKKSGKWCPVPEWGTGLAMWNETNRKPAPGMLQHLMIVTGWSKAVTLMVGDSDEDKGAAEAVGCDFMWAWQFFKREKPDEPR